jgi:cytochrome c oxidase subunit IV
MPRSRLHSFDLGPFNVAVALTIAVVKATVVALFFMHLKQSTGLTRLVVASAIVWLLILLTLTFSDYLTRGWRTYG